MATLRGDLVTLESEGCASLAACPGPPAVVTERQACFRPCLPRDGAWGGLEGHDPLPPTHPFPRHKDTQERGDTEKHRRGEVVEPAGAETSHSPTTRTILDVDAPEQAGGAARTRRQGSGHERSTQAAKPWIQTAQP
jgi:hypothetical protein